MITPQTDFCLRKIPSPVGWLTLVASQNGIAALLFENEREGRVRLPEADPAGMGKRFLEGAEHEIREYFSGDRKQFDFPLDPVGTEFQMSVWRELRGIPYGATLSYKAVAERLGMPQAVRAVASAVGKNPLCIAVPCHRVIGADGRLIGFAGGIATKRWLLDLESGSERATIHDTSAS